MDKLLLSIHKIVSYLDGKKALISSVLNPVISYLVSVSFISPDLGLLLSTIVAALCGGALAVGASTAYKQNKQMGKV